MFSLLILFIIQIAIVLIVVFYIYFTFRHNVKIQTAEQLIEQLSPGLTELTKTENEIVFWFYSVGRQKYVKYTLDSELKITEITNASANNMVDNPSSGYYFNFSKQKWEKINFTDKLPYVNATRNTIEQRFQICRTQELDGGGEVICTDDVKRTFIKMNISDELYSWDTDVQKLVLRAKTAFPSDATMCQFTINRYKEYLGVLYNSDDYGNTEEKKIGVYFKYTDKDGWLLVECPNTETMHFDGRVCVNNNDLESGGGRNYSVPPTHNLSNEIFNSKLTNSDLVHREALDLASYCIQLNVTHSICINMNTPTKTYEVGGVDYYKSCANTIFVIGTARSIENFQINNGDHYDWKLQQLIDNNIRDLLMSTNRRFCHVLEQPEKIFYTNTGEISDEKRHFVIYKNNIFYMFEYLGKLMEKISSMQTMYTIDDDDNNNGENLNINQNIMNNKLLPHVRKYEIVNKHATKCILYAMHVGECVFDVYGETRLLVDFIEDIHHYDYFNRATYPIIEDDFSIDTWSCAQNVEQPEMFTYIPLVDIYNNLASHATLSKNIPTTRTTRV